ncbi:GGL domain-containing protein [Gamsiella multidivaricata]|uniref:GGL domain-containing protein n=1 Tax=Gamsiella multidivaricata TaxID=101098 RepID=UPI00221FEE6A|nr:GGL domain-containing protein [Gamsiella multidivaricata]KAI7832620.1 GGL domain-containing protein [Gamsiella multidivaricata]
MPLSQYQQYQTQGSEGVRTPGVGQAPHRPTQYSEIELGGPGLGGAAGVSEVKLRRFLEHNQRLREQLQMPRIRVSEASQSLIGYVTSTGDPLLPMIWGSSGSDPFVKKSSKCCNIC